MNKIYIIVGECRADFVKICKRFTKDINEIDEAVQETMLNFLKMNPDTLKKIYEKDGRTGIIRYATVILRRSFTSKTSPYYYKYKMYYTKIKSAASRATYDIMKTGEVSNKMNLYNIPEDENPYIWKKLEKIDVELEKMYWYDAELFKLYYYEDNTLDSLAKKTGISRNSIFSTIDKVRKELKDILND
tara:strand:+ start:918 stop:1481 length:564 start_codon:yes stop_codon:yes gene_type:complete